MTEPSPEAPPGFPRDWAELPDPADPGHVIRLDLTWLCSSWQCVYGRGCRGIVTGRPDDGCCSQGVFFTGPEDERRVLAAAGELEPADWQFAHVAAERAVTVQDSSGDGPTRRRTLTVDGACVFLNRPGFPAGQGCALHRLAVRTGRHPLTTKPDVCWQLPLHRQRHVRDQPDGTRVTVSTVTEFDRRSWGDTGRMHWWCTSSGEAHGAAEPLYRSYRRELEEMLGPAAYAELARLCAERVRTGRLHRHPADQAVRSVLP